MINYKRIPYKNAAGDTGFRYTKNNKMTKESRIPQEVMERFTYTDAVEYDDAPERRRCIFCDAPQSRQRFLNNEMVDLCEYHYQNKNLGTIAAQVRLLKEEQESEDGRKRMRKESSGGKRKRTSRKTKVALNYID